MDIVITYVNGLDPEWQKEYEKHTNVPILEKRFRDWGTLRYLFRGIEKNMPFIRKVHLVVSQESQVPEWINRNEVNVVFHRDIIPAEYLPGFNSNLIEMHLHRIKDLDEEFLYFNDDIFPIAKCDSTDFFREGKGVIGISSHLFVMNTFKQICYRSDRMARLALGVKPTFVFLRPQHTCTPMLKSECNALYKTIEPQIKASLTRVRSKENITQYLFTNYLYLQGKIINERQSKKHFSAAVTFGWQLRNFIKNPTRKLVCINDVKLTQKRYVKMREMLLSAFEDKFPQKSKFEQ